MKIIFCYLLIYFNYILDFKNENLHKFFLNGVKFKLLERIALLQSRIQSEILSSLFTQEKRFPTTGTHPGTGTWRRSKWDKKSCQIGIFITVLMSHGTKNVHKTWRRDLRAKRLGTTALEGKITSIGWSCKELKFTQKICTVLTSSLWNWKKQYQYFMKRLVAYTVEAN